MILSSFKKKEGIKEITIEDKNYPKLLREISNPPKILYVKGEISQNENCFAVVGTRMCSSYGKEIALEIAGNLAESGLTIVSGLAPGIDTFCHISTLERKGKTIAVLGTGIDEKSVYPQSNLKLAGKILQSGGALISEYPPGTPGSKFSFPQRNRIISGLSIGTLVIEAKQKSGALITANWAEKQNRKIFAVPGSVYSLNSNGCHYLIKHKKAKLIESANDILKELNLKCSNLKFEQNATGETEEENLILEALKEEILDVDKIIEKTKLPASKTSGALAFLEIKGKVRNLGGNIYAISHR